MLRSLLTLTILAATPLRADPPMIEGATAERSGMGWRFEVTVRHADEGWGHYVDGWAILDETGKKIAYRKLHHPHVNEQPFTRSLPSVMVPDGTRKIYIQAFCSTGGKSEKFKVKLKP
ncbi:hypothetical protein ATO6_02775 [Oceanicola sp. 22II-s10i]|uniref:hypothetical protein n=1 Tax=Oceanicola sp. 22II-s10i TaxID=1317116 RepID=UPI000B5238F1|nr:hypothetical protein [Oceanicola sp. 22II-s10i]OWU85841.1 hypothetical protein ATO6_02775 [Oceanicola sp. 22II-s10i]